MKKLPIGIQTFDKLINGNYLYVDKTEQIYHLVTQGQCYFLARPRRFGKSLLVSTLKALFEGRRELFAGLWIDSSDYDWETHVVLDFNFSTVAHKTPQELEEALTARVDALALLAGIPIKSRIATIALNELVLAVSRIGKKVVFLIDEYDYPLLSHLLNQEHRSAIQEIMRSFYTTIKGLDEYTQFVFLTGVSKFSQTSVFSGLNNLRDITYRSEYVDLLGYTQQELKTCFTDRLTIFAHIKQVTVEQIFADLKQWYDGYRFTEDEQYVYNPFSILCCLDEYKFKNFWFRTGTPTFLFNLLTSNKYAIEQTDGAVLNSRDLDSMELERPRLIPLLFQTGYLTIQTYDQTTEQLRMTYPNKEVKSAFLSFFAAYLTNQDSGVVENQKDELLALLNAHNIHGFCSLLKIIFANIPHTIQLQHEKYYQSLFYVFMMLMGAKIQVEVATNIGRIDAVIETPERIFVIEFKLGMFANAALDQIIERKYYEKYLTNTREIMLLGISFDTQAKNISECQTAVVEH